MNDRPEPPRSEGPDERSIGDAVRGSVAHPTDRFRDELRDTVAAALRGDVPLTTASRSTAHSLEQRRRWAVGGGLAAAAASVLVVAVVSFSGDGPAAVVPATEPSIATTTPVESIRPVAPSTSAASTSIASTTDAPSTTVGSDPAVVAALVDHRWVLESATDGSYSSTSGPVPWIEFADDGAVRGSDGCNVFGARTTIRSTGRLSLDDLASTTAACDETVPQVSFTAAQRIELLDDGERIRLLGPADGAGGSWQFRRLDALAVATESDLVGRWDVLRTPPGYLELEAPDPLGTATLGTCSSSWRVVDGSFSTGFGSLSCVDGSGDVGGALVGVLARGAEAFVDRIESGPTTLLLSSGDAVYRAGFAGRVTGPVMEVSPRASLPSLAVADEFGLAFEERESTALVSWTPRVELTDDGSVVALDLVASTVTAYEVDGSVRWTTPIPAEIDGRRPWDVELGPDRMLYLSYAADGAGSFALVAVPIDGTSAGQAVGVWPTAWQCVETFCGSVRLAAAGVVLDEYGIGEVSVQPYVDSEGRPTGATSAVPATATVTYDVGPRLPTDAGVDDGAGLLLGSFRTTVSLGASTWTFDAYRVAVAEGTYAFFDAQPDGSVASTFTVFDVRGSTSAGDAWVDLLPDGSVQGWWLPDDLGAVVSIAWIGGERYAVVVTFDGAAYRLVHLVPG